MKTHLYVFDMCVFQQTMDDIKMGVKNIFETC